MDYKKFLVPVLMLFILASVSATMTPSISAPDGRTFNTNLGDDFMLVTFTAIDNNADNAIHTTTIQFNTADGNVLVANDANLGSNNCSFTVDNVWTTPGATCTFRFNFPTGNNAIGTGNYVLDVNATALNSAGHFEASGTDISLFAIDNRFIDSATEAMLNILPIVLIAALLVGIILLGFGVVSTKTVLMLAVGAIVSLIAVIVLAIILGVMVP